MSVVFKEDIAQIIADTNLPWADMKGASVLITGATGMIGFALTHALRAASDKHGLILNIIATGRNKEKLDKLLKNKYADIAYSADIRNALPENKLPDEITYIFHCAAITKSKEMIEKPIDVIATSVDGTKNALDIARIKNVKTIVYLSSMEIYGQTDKEEVCEEDMGYLDLQSLRSSYPESKRCCENLCFAYATQYGTHVKIARLSQTFGAGTPADDTRVFAQFARSAMENKDIILHTEGKMRGNYCYLADTISGMLYILLAGKNKEIYNVSNPQASVTIREMAEIVANEVCSGLINVKSDIARTDKNKIYPPATGYIINADKLKALGWNPRYGLADMYVRMLSDWRLQGEICA